MTPEHIEATTRALDAAGPWVAAVLELVALAALARVAVSLHRENQRLHAKHANAYKWFARARGVLPETIEVPPDVDGDG